MNKTDKLIGIVVALPEERMALVKRLKEVKRITVDSIPFYSGRLSDRYVCVAEGGMGTASATKAARTLLSKFKPALIISSGFCGALRDGAKVADMVICKRLYFHNESGLDEVALPGNDMASGRLSAELQSKGIRTWQGSFITTDRIVSKSRLSEELPDNLATPVLEMETASVAVAAGSAGVPFLGLRVVSDDASEELGFSLAELTDDQFRISIPSVLFTCLKKPRIIPQLARLAANSGKAGKALGIALEQIIVML